ncbi:AraC family transcriptional regulator [Alcanivorax sp.]|uniref:AraC family transcriptional regulator n=1 Tax=Alcanivorax sp. TaxID=1872427 RepID=UPI0025B9FD9D|nr:AraC family transcriptional regulator [Alcanivorax sp.]
MSLSHGANNNDKGALPHSFPMTDAPPIYSLLPVNVALLRHLSLNLPAMGLDLDSLLLREGYRADTLLEEQKDVPALVLEKLLGHCLDETGDELFGFHLGQRVKPEGFGVVGYIRQACQNLQNFILVCIRYEHLISGLGKTRLLQEPGRSLWCWSANTLNPTFQRHATEFMLAVLHSTKALLKPTDYPWLLEVQFEHDAPSTQGAREEIESYFGCRVRYNQNQNALALDPRALTHPFSSADPDLMHSLERHAQSLEAAQVDKGFYYVAYQTMKSLLLSKRASKQNLAQALGISSRHLHRQLAREHINYRTLHDQVLLTQAIDALSESNRTIEDIALALGYTESQSFIRWFKKQTGQTPSRYRESTLSQPR